MCSLIFALFAFQKRKYEFIQPQTHTGGYYI